mmetsp:Transcript_25797/g.45806  ORF Transcript_25797/g.45806 Transcript_25797/m.45806 type:complete len:125 (+) Transcript_25797:126-500(+)|eukprot:CAMPEP_0197529076 /NCGR_PEP_ID=MMETSP1318-20131121/27111_1 /TAXON_ID=552666 /ORGANISM="Partenskyella glossopodia, Strain RCC365" /LENGTH=124 /DNA_ID=CAMNT_0043084403 /DNA_START=63 /DNA_END=437 /DNA_ORIENTATION=+
MRLLTHNMLCNPMKGFENAFPLKLIPTKITKEEVKYNPAFIVNMIPKLDYKALTYAASTVGVKDLPSELPLQISAEQHDVLLRSLHHTLLEIHVEEGKLVCPKSNREFPIKQGIPNMRLNEDEV